MLKNKRSALLRPLRSKKKRGLNGRLSSHQKNDRRSQRTIDTRNPTHINYDGCSSTIERMIRTSTLTGSRKELQRSSLSSSKRLSREVKRKNSKKLFSSSTRSLTRGVSISKSIRESRTSGPGPNNGNLSQRSLRSRSSKGGLNFESSSYREKNSFTDISQSSMISRESRRGHEKIKNSKQNGSFKNRVKRSTPGTSRYLGGRMSPRGDQNPYQLSKTSKINSENPRNRNFDKVVNNQKRAPEVIRFDPDASEDGLGLAKIDEEERSDSGYYFSQNEIFEQRQSIERELEKVIDERKGIQARVASRFRTKMLKIRFFNILKKAAFDAKKKRILFKNFLRITRNVIKKRIGQDMRPCK